MTRDLIDDLLGPQDMLGMHSCSIPLFLGSEARCMMLPACTLLMIDSSLCLPICKYLLKQYQSVQQGRPCMVVYHTWPPGMSAHAHTSGSSRGDLMCIAAAGMIMWLSLMSGT